MTNINTQTSQTRSSGARVQNSKPTIWSQNTAQSRETGSAAPENSWAQAMGSRTTNQLDFSSTSFPSLNNNGQQASSLSNAASAWQTGPPHSDSTHRQPLQSTRPQASRQQQATDAFFSTDSFSRTAQLDFSMNDHNSQPPRRSSAAPSGPPGLVQRQPQLNDGVSADPSRVTSPAGLPQDSRSPLPANMNGTIGQDRPGADGVHQSSPASQLPRDAFASRETFEQNPEQTAESLSAGLSERDRWGMKGYLAFAEGPSSTFRSLMRGQDLGALGLNMNSEQSLLPLYTGPFAPPNTHPPRPLDTDYTIPDCYTVKKVAPLHTRINSFSDETLFYIFYSMPRDYMQVAVGQELMERKWRYHMREQMWMMRDESSGGYVYDDQRTSEQGYYIWWDKNLWKKVRRAYTLRYEDLDDLPNVQSRRVQPGMSAIGGGVGVGVGTGGMFNAVPNLERQVAAGRGF